MSVVYYRLHCVLLLNLYCNLCFSIKGKSNIVINYIYLVINRSHDLTEDVFFSLSIIKNDISMIVDAREIDR